MSEEKEWNVPMPTARDSMTSKKEDYELVANAMIHSNRGIDEGYGVRYLYKNKIDKKEFSEKMNKSVRTLDRKLAKIEKEGCKIIKAKETDNGIVYKIKYTNKDGREFVTVNSKMLSHLVKVGNSNTIKVYLLMCYHLRNGRKQMTKEFIAKEIGLSHKSSGNAFDTITSILKSLALQGYIRIYEKKSKFASKKENIDTEANERRAVQYEYELCTREEWGEVMAKAINKQEEVV